MVQENRVIVVCGPTASGKSKIALELAQKLNTEIISADSLAIYQKLDIGTAKPSKEELKLVKHHLIDCVSPFDTFTVDDYESLALPIIENLHKENKIPIICGGTGYYIKSLLYDFSYGNTGADEKLREYYKNIAKEKGNEYLFSILQEKDYESSLKLSPNDTKRVIRAIEIFDLTGIKKSSIIDDKKPRFSYFAYMPTFDRDVLYDRIEKRVDIMIENGLIEEVKGLISEGVTIENQCMQGIGYKEVYDGIIKDDLSGVVDLIKKNTRHYAKRQITYFKKLDNLKYLTQENCVDEILKDYE